MFLCLVVILFAGFSWWGLRVFQYFNYGHLAADIFVYISMFCGSITDFTGRALYRWYKIWLVGNELSFMVSA